MNLAPKFSIFFSTILLVLLTAPLATAATVKSTTATKALLTLGRGESLAVGDTLYAKDAKGGQKAALVITTVRKKQALAEIRSGTVEEGDVVSVYLPTVKTVDVKEEKPAKNLDTSKLWNASFTLGLAQQAVKLTDAATVGMSGPSISLRASMIGKSFPQIARMGWEAGLGLDYISTTGTISTKVCDGSADCSFDSIGLTPFGRVTYNTSFARFRAGLDFHLPISISSNVIDGSAFSPLVFAAAGIEWRYELEQYETYVPITIEGLYDFGSSDVTFYRVNISVGYAFP